MTRTRLTTALLAASVLLLAGCSGAPTGDDGKLKAVSSFSILSDIVREVGGDGVEVHNVVPVGNDPHEYEPKPEDSKATQDADVVFYNGLNLEGGDTGWVHKLLEATGRNGDDAVEAAAGVEPEYLGEEKGNAGQINPHAFLDPNVGMTMARNVHDGLVAADPEHAADYDANLDSYLGELQKIDGEYREKIGSIPEEDRVLVTSERAYQYVASRYGLREGFIWEIDTEEIGTPSQIKDAVAFIEKHDPPALFVESNVDPRPMETVSRETGKRIAGTLYSDELGKQGSEGETYVGFLRSNIEKIHEGLSS